MRRTPRHARTADTETRRVLAMVQTILYALSLNGHAIGGHENPLMPSCEQAQALTRDGYQRQSIEEWYMLVNQTCSIHTRFYGNGHTKSLRLRARRLAHAMTRDGQLRPTVILDGHGRFLYCLIHALRRRGGNVRADRGTHHRRRQLPWSPDVAPRVLPPGDQPLRWRHRRLPPGSPRLHRIPQLLRHRVDGERTPSHRASVHTHFRHDHDIVRDGGANGRAPWWSGSDASGLDRCERLDRDRRPKSE